MAPGRTVLAAGGVVWRRQDGTVEVALVHRPRYDDWTLPKGKLWPGESDLAAAVREVGEELGATIAVSRRVGTVRYELSDGVRKKVAYWAMLHHGGDFVPNDEVDDVEWLSTPKARKRLSYDADRGALRDFAALPAPDAVLVLVRHAKAGKSSAWRGEDSLRPLDANGVEQADRLALLLSYFAPHRVYSADPVRCVQTVEPLAAALDVQVRVDTAFGDDAFVINPGATQLALLALAKPGEVSVVCSQGTTIPALVDRLGPGTRSSETRKGAWWVLTLTDGDVVTADHYDAP
ncbi:MAG: NUDIX hydrolase [Actinomycetota bacterium]|nr:NUDIX hydrolase [Actinomycetota bacterium]